MSVSIKYKGTEIASASTEVTKTIKTAGKYCEADILVKNTPDGGGGVEPPVLPDDEGYVYITLYPSENPQRINMLFNAAIDPKIEYGLLKNGVFNSIGILYDETGTKSENSLLLEIPEYNDYLVVKCRMTNASRCYSASGSLRSSNPSIYEFHYNLTKAEVGANMYLFYPSAKRLTISKEIVFSGYMQTDAFNECKCDELIINGCNKISDNNIKLPNPRICSLRNYKYNNGIGGMGNTFSGNTELYKLDITGSILNTTTSISGVFNYCYRLKDLNLSDCNMSGVTNTSNTFAHCYNLINITTNSNTIFPAVSFGLPESQYLSNNSLVNIANALPVVEAAQTLALHATPKDRLATIMGAVADGVFTADASGTVTLENFITQTKGWTVA